MDDTPKTRRNSSLNFFISNCTSRTERAITAPVQNMSNARSTSASKITAVAGATPFTSQACDAGFSRQSRPATQQHAPGHRQHPCPSRPPTGSLAQHQKQDTDKLEQRGIGDGSVYGLQSSWRPPKRHHHPAPQEPRISGSVRGSHF